MFDGTVAIWRSPSSFGSRRRRGRARKASALLLLSFIACSCYLCLPPLTEHRGEQTPDHSCSLLVQHCLVETVAGDRFQEVADQPCHAVLAHRPRRLTQRLQHTVAEWQRFVWQRQVGTFRQCPAFAERDATLRAEHLQRAEFDAVY